MLTPAEAPGLAGHSVAARVRRALRQLDEGLTKELLSALTTAAWERRCVSERVGKYEAVRLPTPLLADQLQSLHSVSLALHEVTRRLLPMSLADEAVHDGVRLDAVVDVTSAHWKQTLQFIEPNMNGVGGLQPLLAAEAFPMLLRADPRLALGLSADVRSLLNGSAALVPGYGLSTVRPQVSPPPSGSGLIPTQ
jgi:hypothetical protein